MVSSDAYFALGLTDDRKVIKPLLEAVNDPNRSVQASASIALGRIGSPAVKSLLALLKSSDDRLRWNAAQGLAETRDPRASKALLAALRRNDTVAIAGGFRFFIRRGQPGTQSALIAALKEFGDSAMQAVFINCGEKELSEAARIWTPGPDPLRRSEMGYGWEAWGYPSVQEEMKAWKERANTVPSQ